MLWPKCIIACDKQSGRYVSRLQPRQLNPAVSASVWYAVQRGLVVGRKALMMIGSGFKDCPKRVPVIFQIPFEATLLLKAALYSFHIEAVGDCLRFSRGHEGIRIMVWHLRAFHVGPILLRKMMNLRRRSLEI